jgi:hypothetical protein
VLEALAAASAAGPTGDDDGSFSMPAAELFATVAVVAAVSDARSTNPTTVTAVGDCEPAAHALNAATSPLAQMRTLLQAARAISQQWLAVSVPRELNTDADRLSHPTQFDAVSADAQESGLRISRAHPPAAIWSVLARAIADGAGRRKRRRQ